MTPRDRKASNYNMVHAAALKKLYTPSPSKSSLPQGIVGCPNYGNTCYFNTTIQSLFATPPLTDYFLGYDFRNELNKSNLDGSKNAVVAKTFGDTMRDVWKEKSGGGVTDVRALHKALCGFHHEFKDMGQHDIAESLGFLLDAVHEDLNRVQGKKPYVEDVERELQMKKPGKPSSGAADEDEDEKVAAQAWEGYLKRNRSIVVDLFQGQLRSTLMCCNTAKNKGKGCGRQVRRRVRRRKTGATLTPVSPLSLSFPPSRPVHIPSSSLTPPSLV